MISPAETGGDHIIVKPSLSAIFAEDLKSSYPFMQTEARLLVNYTVVFCGVMQNLMPSSMTLKQGSIPRSTLV